MDERFRPSVTVAAVIAQDGRYLMVEETGDAGLALNQPAGHLEAGESLLAAVVRETREETGHAFTPEGLLGTYLCRAQALTGQWHTYLRFAFVGRVGPPDAKAVLDRGIVRALWMTPAEIEAARARHRSPLVWQCIVDHRGGRAPAPLELVYTHAGALARGGSA